jgi:hypothetical protein
MQHFRAPSPLPDGRIPVIFTGFPALSSALTKANTQQDDEGRFFFVIRLTTLYQLHLRIKRPTL